MQAALHRISDNILYLPAKAGTDRPILAVISGTKGSLIVDSGNSSRHARLFLDELKKHALAEPRYVVLTHWHWDHVFGVFEMDLVTIAHRKTQQELRTMQQYQWTREALEQRVRAKTEIPFCADMMQKEYVDLADIVVACADIVFDKRVEIDLGGVTCLVENVGGDHSPDSSVVFVKEDKVLFLGDCLGADIYHGKWHYHIPAFLALLDRLEGFDADVYVESHWKPEGKAEFLRYLDEMRKLASIVAEYSENLHTENLQTMEQKAREALRRDLTDDDREMMEYFLNGLAG